MQFDYNGKALVNPGRSVKMPAGGRNGLLQGCINVQWSALHQSEVFAIGQLCVEAFFACYNLKSPGLCPENDLL